MTEVNHAEREHALLSASSAERWLACPPSARLNYDVEDTTSDYAEEGTRAHQYAEKLLRLYLGHGELGPIELVEGEDQLREEMGHEMYEHVSDYVTYCTEVVDLLNAEKSPGTTVETAIEFRTDYSDYAQGGYGTNDFSAHNGKTLDVIDFKYGQGIAKTAVGNPQLRLYALGRLSELSLLYDIESIRMRIFQPRIHSVTVEKMSVKDLVDWGESIKPIADLAYAGKGEFQAGEHCHFCEIKATCRARAEANLEMAKHEFREAAELNDEEIAEILEKAAQLEKWAKDVQSYALDQAVNHGKKWDGYKLVEGRGKRQYGDEQAAIETLQILFDVSAYTSQSLLSVAQLEKALGKKFVGKLIGEHIVKIPGKATLVKDADSRPELGGAENAKADFTDGEGAD